MDLFIDTFTWKKIDLLSDLSLIKIDEIYEFANICITHEVLVEIENFHLRSCKIEKTCILPIKNKKIYQDALDLDFDLADAALLSNGSRDAPIYIISEDRPMISFARGYGFKILQLIELCILMTEEGLISKNDLYRINRKLFDMRNISQKLEKFVKRWISEN